jgi:hypothetical protein
MAFNTIIALLVAFFNLGIAAPADRARITSAAVFTAQFVPRQSECVSNTPAEICTKYVNGAETWMECAPAYWDPGMGCLTGEPTTMFKDPPATTADAPVTTEDAPITAEEPTATATAEQPPVTTEQPPVTTEEPTVTTEEPIVTTEEPIVSTEEPTVTTEEPTVTTEEPTVTTEELTVTTEESTTTWVDAPITETPVTTDGPYTETSAVETPVSTVDTDTPLCSFYAFTEAECTEQMRAKRTAMNTLERLPEPIPTNSAGNFSFSVLPYTSSTPTNTLVFHTPRRLSTSVSDLETMPTVTARDEIP